MLSCCSHILQTRGFYRVRLPCSTWCTSRSRYILHISSGNQPVPICHKHYRWCWRSKYLEHDHISVQNPIEVIFVVYDNGFLRIKTEILWSPWNDVKLEVNIFYLLKEIKRKFKHGKKDIKLWISEFNAFIFIEYSWQWFLFTILWVCSQKICVYSRKIALYLARVWRLFAKFMGLFAKETFACFVNKTKNKKP